jgi:tetratricopeptide (TPR) repeat protein
MKLGTRVPLVLTHNTRAAVEVHAGQYQAAEPHAEKALQISQNLSFDRGVGLSLLTLTRLHRFMSEHPETSAKEKLQLLRKSLKESKQALKYFREDEEPERRLEAFYEQGLTHRQLTLVDENQALEHGEAAIHNLEAARQVAVKENLWQKYLDASLGLAWTYYYLQKLDLEKTTEKGWKDPEVFLESLEREIEENFRNYLITKHEEPEIVGEAVIVEVFSQLGRFHVLRGIMAMDRFDVGVKRPPYSQLCNAIREFVLALEYSEQVGEEYQGIRRGLHTIYNRLKGLNVDEVLAAFETIREIAEVYEPIAERNRLWRELENAFGSYEQYKLLTSKQVRGTFLP